MIKNQIQQVAFLILTVAAFTIFTGCNTKLPVWMTHGKNYKTAFEIVKQYEADINTLMDDIKKQSEMEIKADNAIFDRFPTVSIYDPRAVHCDDGAYRTPEEIRARNALERIHNKARKTLLARIDLLKDTVRKECRAKGVSEKTANKAWSDFTRHGGGNIQKMTLGNWFKKVKSNWTK